MYNPTNTKSWNVLCQIIGTNNIVNKEKHNFDKNILDIYKTFDYIDLLRLNIYRMGFGDYSTNINNKLKNFSDKLCKRYKIQQLLLKDGINEGIKNYINV